MSFESETARDQQIERLVREIEQLIDEADPQQRTELRQMAIDLLQEQNLERENAEAVETSTETGRPLTVLTFAVGILALGVVLFLLVPLIGSFLILVGLVGVGLSLIGRFLPHSFSKLRHRY